MPRSPLSPAVPRSPLSSAVPRSPIQPFPYLPTTPRTPSNLAAIQSLTPVSTVGPSTPAPIWPLTPAPTAGPSTPAPIRPLTPAPTAGPSTSRLSVFANSHSLLGSASAVPSGSRSSLPNVYNLATSSLPRTPLPLSRLALSSITSDSFYSLPSSHTSAGPSNNIKGKRRSDN